MSNDIITLTELFEIFRERLDKNIGYCTIYSVLEDRVVFSINEVDDIIENIKLQHLRKTKPPLSLAV